VTEADSSPENLRRSRRQTELELMRHLGHDHPSGQTAYGFIAGQATPTEAEAKSFVLRTLIGEGYIKGPAPER